MEMRKVMWVLAIGWGFPPYRFLRYRSGSGAGRITQEMETMKTMWVLTIWYRSRPEGRAMQEMAMKKVIWVFAIG
jgi:hypothetical protein